MWRGGIWKLLVTGSVVFSTACNSPDKKSLVTTPPPSKPNPVCLRKPAAAPAPILPKGCFATPVEKTGDVRVLVPYGDPLALAPKPVYVLHTDDGDTNTLNFGDTTPSLHTGDTVTVTGTQVECPGLAQELKSQELCNGMPSEVCFADPIAVSSTTPATGAAPGGPFPFSGTFGAQSTLAILVSFHDHPANLTLSQVQDVVFNQVNAYWQDTSYGQTSVTGQAVGPFTILSLSSSCDPDVISSQARAAASAAGVDLSQYRHYVYFFDYTTSCGPWIGLGTIGGYPSEAWINGSAVMHTVAHEMGHNLGLYHSNALNCGLHASIGTNCTNIEYGDPMDVMGVSYPGQYTAYQKEQLGWLNFGTSPTIQTVTADGTYTIDAFETTGTATPKALKVMRSKDPATGLKNYFYVEYRQPIGMDTVLSPLPFSNNATSGVLVHLGSEADMNSSYLLNMNPGSNSWFQSALNVGETFTDAAAQVTLTLQSANGAQATVAVTVGNGQGAPVNCD